MTRIEVINRALLRIGAMPVVDDLDPAAVQHVAVYDAVLADLASKPFDFFKTTRRLVRLSQAQDQKRYAYAYQIPADRIGTVRAVYIDAAARQPLTDFDIEGDLLLADPAQIWATVLTAGDPVRWPGDFTEAFMVTLMAELALSVREDRALHDRLWSKARGTPIEGGNGGLLKAALEANAQETGSAIIGGGVNPLIDVRY